MAVLRRDNPIPPQIPTDLQNHDVHSILGPESQFDGKLLFEGTVRIDGRFQGEIHTDGTLVVGQTAHLSAQISVGVIIINGEINGDITAKQAVEINAPAKVRGTISTPSLTIAKGVLFEGTVKMTESLNIPQSNKQSTVTILPNNREAKPAN